MSILKLLDVYCVVCTLDSNQFPQHLNMKSVTVQAVHLHSDVSYSIIPNQKQSIYTKFSDTYSSLVKLLCERECVMTTCGYANNDIYGRLVQTKYDCV